MVFVGYWDLGVGHIAHLAQGWFGTVACYLPICKTLPTSEKLVVAK